MALRAVKYTINEFRDSAWENLVQARNRLVEAVISTALGAYGLLIFVVLQGVTREALFAASIFFLIGALVGLIDQLRINARSQAKVDDYGLEHARLLHIPLFSGLAAIIGVTLFAMTPKLFNAEVLTPATATPTVTVVSSTTVTNQPAQTITVGVTVTAIATSVTATTTTGTAGTTATATATAPPTATVAAGAGRAPDKLPPLDDIFSLTRNLFGLVVAAAFGFAPGLLVAVLQKQTEQFKLNIKSTEAQEGSRK